MQTSSFSANQVVYRFVRVTGDWLPDDLAIDAYWSGLRWNGFVTPLFTLAAARILCEHVPCLEYVERDASFLLTDEYGMTCTTSKSYIVGGEALQLYGVGDSWCWRLVVDADEESSLNLDARTMRLRVPSTAN